MRDHPEINVNWTNPDHSQWSGLHAASFYGHAEAVKLLLAHANIEVNLKDWRRQTPFSFGCVIGHVSVVEVQLQDPRVDITLDDKDGCSPLWHAALCGGYQVIEWLISSGRNLGDIKNKKGKNWRDDKNYTALEIARKNESEVGSLLERYLTNPALTHHELRVKLGVLDEVAAEVFALTVFLCDDLLRLRPACNLAATSRFFIIASKMPLELQRILCHRAVGSMKQNILHKDSEAAFKSPAWVLRSQPQ